MSSQVVLFMVVVAAAALLLLSDHSEINAFYFEQHKQQKQHRAPTERPWGAICLWAASNDDGGGGGERPPNVPIGAYSARCIDDNGLSCSTDIVEGFTTGTPSTPLPGPAVEEDEDEEGGDFLDGFEYDVDELYDDFEEFDYTFLTENEVREDDDDGDESLQQATNGRASRPAVQEHSVQLAPLQGFNVVLTHCTADFDSLASAVGLAKLWSFDNDKESALSESPRKGNNEGSFDSSDKNRFPTFVVLPRGAHPSVQRFLALHKHLFPIRSLKSLPSNLSGLNRLGLVDAQRRDRIGPAEPLLKYANRVTVVDHHVDSESDIPEATDYVVDQVGSVSTLIVERLMEQQQKRRKNVQCSAASIDGSSAAVADSVSTVTALYSTSEGGLTEAEATLLALGIHADTGSLCYDSTTPRDAAALAWVMAQGASQAAIAEHAQSSLSREQQGVLTQALINTNSTVVHGVTVSTVLLTADGFINGLAAVAQDAMELSSSDVYLLGLVYEPKSGGQKKRGRKNKDPGHRIKSRLLMDTPIMRLNEMHNDRGRQEHSSDNGAALIGDGAPVMETVGWKGGEEALLRKRLRLAFDRKDLDGSGNLDLRELSTALAASGIIVTKESLNNLMETMDINNDGSVDFEEFVTFAKGVQASITESSNGDGENGNAPASTLIIIGRAKAGVNLKSIKLGKLLEKYGGGGHAKAASATVRLNDESEASGILSGLVEELIATSLNAQPTVGDFMTSPVLSVKPDMTETQVEDLFTRFDVRSLPVVDENNNVIGLVTYKEVAAAKQRLWNKEQKRMREAQKTTSSESNGNATVSSADGSEEELERRKALSDERRRRGTTVKAWMLQHVMTVEASRTMAEVEAILVENDVGCVPVVEDGSLQLVGMVTRTDLLRQHRYYPSLHYHNKGMSDSIAARQPIIELRKRLKKFDLDE